MTDYSTLPPEVLRWCLGAAMSLGEEGIGGKYPLPEGLLEAAADAFDVHPCTRWDLGLIDTETHALTCDCKIATTARAARGL